MLRKTILGLFAVVFLISLSVLTAHNRGSKSISTVPPMTPTAIPAAITPIVWSPDIDCAICHVMQPYVASMQDSSLMVYNHAQKGFVCLDCHEQGVLVEVHGESIQMLLLLKSESFRKNSALHVTGAMQILSLSLKIALNLQLSLIKRLIPMIHI